MIEALRVTDSYQPLTHLCVIRVSKWNRREIRRSFYFQNGKIQFITCAKHFGFIWFLCILYCYLNNICIMHHMLIG
ncbi:hypothetical protein D3C76_1604740 [compost metagenome]